MAPDHTAVAITVERNAIGGLGRLPQPSCTELRGTAAAGQCGSHMPLAPDPCALE